MTRLLPLCAASALAIAIFSSASASLASPSFGPEHDLTPFDFYGGERPDTAPAVATSGTDYLVAWSDGGSIECARLKQGGAPTYAWSVLDQPSIQLDLRGQAPAVFWDGTEYLVLSGTGGERIDPVSGTMAPPFALQGAPALYGTFAFGGGHILDVWLDATDQLTGAIFNEDGTLVAGNLALPTGRIFDWAVGSSMGGFFVVWTTEQGDVSGARVTASGGIEDATPLALESGTTSGDAGGYTQTSNLDVAASPTGYLVSWNEIRNGSAGLYASRVGADATISDPGGLAIAPGQGAAPHAAWTGSAWLIAVPGNVESLGYTLGATGTTAVVGLLGGGVSAIAASADQGVIVATSPNGAAGPIFGTVFGPCGDSYCNSTSSAYPNGFAISSYPSPQIPIEVATSSAGYLVVWVDGGGVFGMRFGFDGTAFDTTPIPFPLAPAGDRAPWLAACGAIGVSYYVAVGNSMVTLPAVGTPDVSPFLTDVDGGVSGIYALDMTCLSDRCLLAGATGGYDDQTTVAMIFDRSGNLIAPRFEVRASVVPAYDFPSVLVANDGTSFLLAENYYVVPIGADGTVGAPLSEGDGSIAALAGGGGAFLLGGAQANQAYFFSATGTLLGAPTPLPLAAPNGSSIGAAWDGTDFFVAQGVSGVGAPAVAGMDLSSPSPEASDGGVDAGASGFDGGAPTLALFDGPGAVVVGSDGAGRVVAISAQPRGPYDTPRLVARFAVPETPDAGALDSGAPDGAADAGHPSAAKDAGPDATSVESQDGGAPSTASNGSGGCGCTAAGTDAAPPLGWLSLAFLPLLARRRRPRAS